MKFSGKHQAFLAAKFNVRLKQEFGEQGRKAFIHASQCYAEQRGHRMAQRAIRDNRELNAETYERYRELLAGHIVEIKETSPDLVLCVKKCEWAEYYDELELVEAGREYCTHLDLSISRGFNPYMPYEINLDVDGCWCEHRLEGANIDQSAPLGPVEGVFQSLEYHCGNLYWVFSKILVAIFDSQGQSLSEKVLADFAEEFGVDMANRLMLYRNLDYDVCNGGTVV